MKTIIYSLLILLPALVPAQDVLYKTDNSKQEVKIVEVTETTIKYKAFNNPDGPFYTLSKNNVALIIYQNGQHETFKEKPVEQPATVIYCDPRESVKKSKEKRYLEVTKNKNVFFFNAVELLNSGIGVSYMREVCDNKFIIHVPFASSFNRPELDNALSSFGANPYTILHTRYDMGLGFYINTGGKRSVTHFIGPLVRNAQYSGNYNYYNRENFTNGTSTFSMNETSLMLNNGFLYRFTPRFNMMIHFAIGQFIHRTVSPDGPSSAYGNLGARNIAIHAGFHFGYRF
jgi:hypothetical protein